MSTSATPLLRRRNGRSQACEPCRKRKVACDHTYPICNRCTKRKQQRDCVYNVSSHASSSALNPPSTSPQSTKSPPGREHATLRPRYLINTPEDEFLQPTATRPGYLGFTSYCAVLAETQDSLSSLHGHRSSSSTASGFDNSPLTTGHTNALSARTRETCLCILRNVPDEARGRLHLRGRPNEAWIFYFVREVLDSLYSCFGHYFNDDRSDKSLDELARIICLNTTRHFSDEESSSRNWLEQFIGPNIRWETIGLLFSFWDFNADRTTIHKSPEQDEYGRPSLLSKECLGLCVELCKYYSVGNTLYLYLSLRRSLHESLISGDASLLAWTYHAETVATLTFLGYHALDDPKPYQPVFTTEIKRRLYHHVYIIDMIFVGFTGRPPLLSSKFTSTPLPLDIRNGQLFSDKDALAKAMEDIDENGWNKSNTIHSATCLRARSRIISIREELIQIALAFKNVASIDSLLEIKERELQAFHSFPKPLKYEAGGLEDPKVSVGQLHTRLLLQLEHLQNLFFAERLLHRHGYESSDILSVSYDMLTYTLPFWTHQERCLDLRADCEWLVMAYGVPAGGILCLELLKPTLHRHPPVNASITRSGIIQKLSLLVGFLDWIRPDAPNGSLCLQCKSIINHVLDQTLNASTMHDEPTAGFDWDFSTQADFNFDLLDTFDWTRPGFSSSQ